MNFSKYFKHILPLMQNSLLPVLLLCSALGCFFIFAPFNEHILETIHISFFITTISIICILGYFNQNKPLFYLLTMAICYCLINYYKFEHGVIYYLTPDYLNLCFFSAIGFAYFYFLPNRPFISQDTIWFLLVIFTAIGVIESLNAHGISLNYNIFTILGSGLQPFGFVLFIIISLVMLVHSSIKNEILTTSLFYATLNIIIAFYFSNRPTSFSIFFLNAALTIFLGVIHSIYYSINKDTVTGLDNGNAFVKNANKFPLKYGLGIISIDDYKHLLHVFKKTGINEIVLMITKKIKELEPEALLYRYGIDEFIIIFPNAEKGSSFARVDNIRRTIAAAQFILSFRKKPLKITVSCSVSEKKRSDSNVFEVFSRTQKVLQKTYKFTQNITSRA